MAKRRERGPLPLYLFSIFCFFLNWLKYTFASPCSVWLHPIRVILDPSLDSGYNCFEIPGQSEFICEPN